MPISLKNIKSLFVVEEEGTASKAPATEKSGTKESFEHISAEAHSIDPSKVSEKFMNIFFAAMEGQNLPGIDYLEYRQSLKSLAKMPMDESIRYQSAFAMAQAMGAVPQKLIDSANHYLEVLKGENSKFNQTLSNQQTEQIEGRKARINTLGASLKEKEELIKKLQAEMDLHSKEMQKLHDEIADTTSKMESTKVAFIASYNSLVSQILQDVENMKKYLK